MRVTTLCQGGHVRSVAAKYLLTYKYGHEVLACGWESNTPETRKMLFEWCDVIVIMQAHFKQYIPEEFWNKTICYDVGPDRFMNPFHPELGKGLIQMIEQHGLFTKKETA